MAQNHSKYESDRQDPPAHGPSPQWDLKSLLSVHLPIRQGNDSELGLPPLTITGEKHLHKIEIEQSGQPGYKRPDFVIAADGTLKTFPNKITNDGVVIELEKRQDQQPTPAQIKELDKIVRSLVDHYMDKLSDGSFNGEIDDRNHLFTSEIASLVHRSHSRSNYSDYPFASQGSFNRSDTSNGQVPNQTDNTNSSPLDQNDAALQQISNATGSAYNPLALAEWVSALSGLGNPPNMDLLEKLIADGKIPPGLGHLLEKNPNLIQEMEQPGFLKSAQNFQHLAGRLAQNVKQADSFFISQLNNAKYNPTGNENEGCGPTSLAMAARALGKMNSSITNFEAMIQEARKKMGVSLDGNVGTGEGDIINGAGNFGLKSEIWHGSISQVDAELAMGHMVIADGSSANGYSLTHPIGGHYILIAGKVGDQYILSDPLNPNGSALVSGQELQRFINVPGGNKGVAIWS